MAASSLLASVQAALGAAFSLGYSNASKAHDVYEAYILTLFLEAAGNQDWQWQLQDGFGHPTTHAVFRLGPGRLPSGNFTHVYLSKVEKQDLEAHIGVKVSGKSRQVASKATKSGHLLHEFDLLVLPSAIAALCRASNTDPPHGSAVVHAEAKYYGGNLSLPLGRASVGMAVECNLAGKSVLVTNRIGLTVQDLVEHHGVRFRFLIKPSNSIGEYYLVRLFENLLRSAP